MLAYSKFVGTSMKRWCLCSGSRGPLGGGQWPETVPGCGRRDAIV